jgi:hypothetical protein
MSIGVYLETWAVKWSSKADNEISNLDPNINTVYLAFAKPDNTYRKGDFKFDGTGLNFSLDFKVVVESIRLLKKRKVKVLLAVGGGSYWSEPKVFNHLGCIDLMEDLECDGIDIDWEVGITNDSAPLNAMSALTPIIMKNKIISFTCFSTGAFEKSINDKYRGMNIKAIKEFGSFIDQINIMVLFFLTFGV